MFDYGWTMIDYAFVALWHLSWLNNLDLLHSTMIFLHYNICKGLCHIVTSSMVMLGLPCGALQFEHLAFSPIVSWFPLVWPINTLWSICYVILQHWLRVLSHLKIVWQCLNMDDYCWMWVEHGFFWLIMFDGF